MARWHSACWWGLELDNDTVFKLSARERERERGRGRERGGQGGREAGREGGRERLYQVQRL